MIHQVIIAESLVMEGLKLMRASTSPDDLVMTARSLAWTATVTHQSAKKDADQGRQATLSATARCLAQSADILVKAAAEAGSDVESLIWLGEISALIAEPMAIQEDEDYALTVEGASEIKFSCPALGGIVSIPQCAKNALLGLEESCSTACEIGSRNIESMGCKRAVQLLEV